MVRQAAAIWPLLTLPAGSKTGARQTVSACLSIHTYDLTTLPLLGSKHPILPDAPVRIRASPVHSGLRGILTHAAIPVMICEHWFAYDRPDHTAVSYPCHNQRAGLRNGYGIQIPPWGTQPPLWGPTAPLQNLPASSAVHADKRQATDTARATGVPAQNG